jgi:hydroxymethylpyrimidine pyrophosphatase-like HAD family hydrolase
MRPRRILALDYDDTLATAGRVDFEAQAALEAFRGAGGLSILVTGRTLEQLREAYDGLATFELVVVENGCVLHRPRTGQSRLLAPPPPAELVALLRQHGVSPLHLGEVVIGTEVANLGIVRTAISASQASSHLVTNRASLMVLPVGVDKSTGLEAALEELTLDAADVVAVGDAENDVPMLKRAGYAVAVANATEEAKAAADMVLSAERGAGVAELVEALLVAV